MFELIRKFFYKLGLLAAPLDQEVKDELWRHHMGEE